MTKAQIGATALTTATVLAMGDNLTGPGPSDPDDPWHQTHRRNSYRVPGTDTWISWEGTPFAIPFGMVAGFKEGAVEAQDRAAKKGQSDPLDVTYSAVARGGRGAAKAFMSQSFVRGIADQYKNLTDMDAGLSPTATAAAGTISRFIPSGSMVNFFARITDSMERETGRPQTATEMLTGSIPARLANRVPGFRQQLDPKLDIYGQPVRNEQSGLAGAMPYYRGPGQYAGDPITQRLEAADVGGISAPPDVPSGVTEGVPIPLRMNERRVFEEASGQAFRRLLEGNDAARMSPVALERLRSYARQAGVVAALKAMDPEDRRRRVQEAVQQKTKRAS
jgi:hypothetical protein